MYRYIILTLVLFTATIVPSAMAQNNTISPYSKFGIGLYEPTGFGRSLAMGNTGVAIRSRNHVNSINPASYSALDSSMVLFDIGLHMEYEYIETHLESGDKLNGNISLFALSISPNARCGFTFGITPYTSCGYTIESKEYISGKGLNTFTSYTDGIGGLTRIYLGGGFQMLKNTSVGMNASVLFGPKTERQSMYINSSDEFSTYIENTDYYVGGKLDFGLQQDINIGKKNLVLGAIISTPGILRCSRTEICTNTNVSSGVVDTIYYDDDDYDRYTTLPMTWGAGFSYGRSGRWEVSAEFNYNPLSNLKVSDRRSKLIDNKTVGIGFEYVPRKVGHNYDLAFRAGAIYESGSYRIDDYTLKTLSATMGVGFRIKAIKFNTFCIYKHKGTLDNLLVLDQSLRLGVNITYIDYWFQKRKFY